MKADHFMKIFFIVIMTISFGIPSATEIVDSPLLKEIAQKKALLYKKPNASKNVMILRRKPIQSEPIKPEPIKNATQPSNRPRIVNVKGSDGELRSYRLVPVTSEDSETKKETEAPSKKENARTKPRTRRIKETPTKDRAFIPPYKFPMWGNPYGIYSNGGFINPGLFPFVPGGPGFPPYDGIFGGPFGPGNFPGNPGNPFPSPPPSPGGGNNRPPYDIPATLAALGYAQPPGQPPLNPTGPPPPGAFSPGSPTGLKRSSTEKPPKSSSTRTTTTRAKQKPKPKPRPVDSGSHSSDGGCSCGKGSEAPVNSRPRTTTPAPPPRCPCGSGKYPTENSHDHDKYKSDVDYETKSPAPCPYSKQENAENKHREISDTMHHASHPPQVTTPRPPPPAPTTTPPTTTHAPHKSSPPCNLHHMTHESSSPQEKPRPTSQPCPLKHLHENPITTTELPHTTQPVYPPQQPMVMPPPPREQVSTPPSPPPTVVTSPNSVYTSTASPQTQHSTGASPQPNTIVFKPKPQEIIHGPTSITVPLPFPFTMDSNGNLQPQHQSHSPGSDVTYKLDLNSDLLTKLTTPVVMTQPQQQPLQYQGNQYSASGLPFRIGPPPPPQSYYSQPYTQPRSRIMVVDKAPKGQFSYQHPSMYQVETPQPSIDWQPDNPDSTYDQQSLSPTPHSMSILHRILNQAKAPRNPAGNLHSSDRFDVRTPMAHSSYGDFSSSEHGESEESHVPSTRKRFPSSNAKSNKNPKHDFVIIDRAELEKLKRSSTSRNTIPAPEKNLPPPADIIHIKLHTDNNEKENVNKPLSFPDSRYYNHNYVNDNMQRVDQVADVHIPSHSHFPNGNNKNFRSSGRRRSSSRRSGIKTRKPAYYY